ncbi:MAG: serine hydrolase domain-containing protein [Caulobacteraceae bacterium]
MEVRGICPERFAPVRVAFEANFAAGLELGARFSLAIGGEVVVDLMGGFADRAQSRPFDMATLTPIFSTTKAFAALMIARLVGGCALSYDRRVADLWPAFGAAGKASLTIGEVLSHQAGLPGLAGPMTSADWYDREQIARRLAAMAPLWPPGSASGYHPVTFGFLADEIFRRVDGRSIAEAFGEDVTRPLGLDLSIGLAEGEEDRLAEVRRPPTPPDLGSITEAKRLAFLVPWASPGGVPIAEQRQAQIASTSGFATAAALALLLSAFACDGRVAGKRVLAPGAAALAATERIRGADLVLPFDLSWGAGLLRNQRLGIYGPGKETIGHSGWGGSCAFADPERRLSGAYVMNRQSSALIGDGRSRRLIEAAYRAL